VIFPWLVRCSCVSDTDVTGAPGDARPDAPSDAQLISAVRDGDVEAYGELFARHVDSARRLARSLTSDGEADDLVSDAFAKVLVVLQRGEGPDTALRPYLLTAIRRLHVDRIRSLARTRPTDDIAAYDEGEPFHDTAVAGFESGAAARAFASLPERWQLVLWHLEVEGQKPADIAPLLGVSPNSVSALAYRAREGLRQAFVSMHAQDADDELCARTRAQLGAFIRNDISKRDGAAVEEHLRDCRECAGIYLELVEVNSDLRALIAPLILGGAAAAYLGGGAVSSAALSGAGGAGLLADLGTSVGGFLGRAVARSVAGTTAAGVAIAGVVVGVVIAVQTGGDERTSPSDTDRIGASSPGVAGKTYPSAPAEPLPSVKPSPDVPSTASPDPTTVAQPTSSASADDQEDEPRDPVRPPDPVWPTETTTTDPTEPEPTEPTEPTDTAEPSVTTSATGTGGLLWVVDVKVSSLAADQPGTITVTLDRPALAIHLDPRCDLVNLGKLTCRLRGPGTVRLLVTPVPGAPTTLTAVLEPGNDRSSVRLG
jgi:RNA polymerase sigma factor (sigma-70 family)